MYLYSKRTQVYDVTHKNFSMRFRGITMIQFSSEQLTHVMPFGSAPKYRLSQRILLMCALMLYLLFVCTDETLRT